MTIEGCCGQPTTRRRARPSPEPLPANPSPAGGIAMVYIGSGNREVAGPRSGLTYFVGGQRRHFRAHPDDVDGLVRRREFILKV
jgi:hypothetical protein